MFDKSASRSDRARHAGGAVFHTPDEASGARGFLAVTALIATAFLFV